MTVRDLVKNASNVVLVICATVIVVAFLGAYVFLAYSGRDADTITKFVDMIMNFAPIIVGSLGAVAAASAARTSGEAKDAAQQAVSQTNGQLDARIENAILSALDRQNAANLRSREPDDSTLF